MLLLNFNLCYKWVSWVVTPRIATFVVLEIIEIFILVDITQVILSCFDLDDFNVISEFVIFRFHATFLKLNTFYFFSQQVALAFQHCNQSTEILLFLFIKTNFIGSLLFHSVKIVLVDVHLSKQFLVELFVYRTHLFEISRCQELLDS